MMTSAQVVETSVNDTINSPSQDYTHPDDHNLPTYDMTPGVRAQRLHCAQKIFSTWFYSTNLHFTSPNSKSDRKKVYIYLKTTSMHIKRSQQSRGTLFARGLVHPPPPMTNNH